MRILTTLGEEEEVASDISRFIGEFDFDAELRQNVAASVSRIRSAIVDDNVSELVLAYSGGKDSTALLVVAAHTLSALGMQNRVCAKRGRQDRLCQRSSNDPDLFEMPST